MARKREQNTQPYKNMKARRGVLLVGFLFSLLGFGLIIFASLLFFAPQFFPSNFLSFTTTIYIIAASMVSCFFGAVLSVAGANTIQALAKFSFLLCSLGFIWGAGMLTVSLAFNHLLPLDAINRVLS